MRKISLSIKQLPVLGAFLAALLIVIPVHAGPAYAATPSLRSVGNEVITANGKQFIPEGISVYGGLEAADYDLNNANVYAQITAAYQYWHANTVRLQVAETNLFSHLKPGEQYNKQFLSALTQQVNYIRSLGMVAVINDQTEFTNNTPSPTAMTSEFWQVVSQHFKNSPYVIFDLFNEPRLIQKNNVNALANDVAPNPFIYSHLFTHYKPVVPISRQRAWGIWRDGGNVNGVSYVGMQQLINQVRATGAQNLIWAEGTYDALQLPPKQYLLHGSNLVYSIHHANLNSPHSWRSIGKLAAIRPVVEGEWAQYQSSWAECYSRAYSDAPKYLNYLHELHIGVIAWSLQPNSLVKGNAHIGQPDNLNTSSSTKRASRLAAPDSLMPTYVCGKGHGQGVGQLLQNYFSQNSIVNHIE
jgi:hypothetical protein